MDTPNPEESIATLEARIAALEHSDVTMQTSINATAQALAAMELSRRNRSYIKELDRKINVGICLAVGAGFVWLGESSLNPQIQQYAIGTGFGSVIWGLAVLTEQDKQVMTLASGLFERFFGRTRA